MRTLAGGVPVMLRDLRPGRYMLRLVLVLRLVPGPLSGLVPTVLWRALQPIIPADPAPPRLMVVLPLRDMPLPLLLPPMVALRRVLPAALNLILRANPLRTRKSSPVSRNRRKDDAGQDSGGVLDHNAREAVSLA